MRTAAKIIAALVVLGFLLELAACGGSSKKASTIVKAPSTGSADRSSETASAAQETAPPADKPDDGDGSFAPIYFAFDSAALSQSARDELVRVADYLAKHPRAHVTLAGHADDRGTPEYNLALGDDRAKATHDYLMRLGVEEGRMRTVSYGEEMPAVQGENEDAWSKNRRVEFQVEGR